MVTRDMPVPGVRCGVPLPLRTLSVATRPWRAGKDTGVLLAAQVRCAGTRPEMPLPPRCGGARQRTPEWTGDPGLQPPLLLRLDLHTAAGETQGDVRRQSGV